MRGTKSVKIVSTIRLQSDVHDWIVQQAVLNNGTVSTEIGRQFRKLTDADEARKGRAGVAGE